MTKSPHPSSVGKGELLPVTVDSEAGYSEAEAMLRDLLTPDLISGTAIRVARDHMMQFIRNDRKAHSLPGDVESIARALFVFQHQGDIADPGQVWDAPEKGLHPVYWTQKMEHNHPHYRAMARAALATLTPSPCPGDVGMLDRIEATIEAAERCMNASPFWDENSRHSGKALLDYPRSQIAHERAALTPSALSGANQTLDLEGLGDALFALSAKLLASGFLNDDANRAVYEKVVAQFQGLPSALSGDAGETQTEAFKRLVDLHDALVLTNEYSDGATVAALVESSSEFEAARKYFHSCQYLGLDEASQQGTEP